MNQWQAGTIIIVTTITVAGALVGGAFASYYGAWVDRRVVRGDEGEGMGGRSHCACGRQLGFLELVPVFGWLRVHGVARCCGAKIPAEYPWTEAAAMVAGALVGWVPGTALAGSPLPGPAALVVLMVAGGITGGWLVWLDYSARFRRAERILSKQCDEASREVAALAVAKLDDDYFDDFIRFGGWHSRGFKYDVDALARALGRAGVFDPDFQVKVDVNEVYARQVESGGAAITAQTSSPEAPPRATTRGRRDTDAVFVLATPDRRTLGGSAASRQLMRVRREDLTSDQDAAGREAAIAIADALIVAHDKMIELRDGVAGAAAARARA